MNIITRILTISFFISLPLSAVFPLELPKSNPVPGGLVKLKIDAGSQKSEPTVYLNKSRVTVLPKDEKTWIALVGIPLNTQMGKLSVRIYWPDGSKSTRQFTVKDKQYPEQRLKINDKNKVDPSKEDLERIWKELPLIKEAKSSWLDNIPRLKMKLPVKGRLSSQFGLKRFFNDKPRNPHSGLDIAAVEGTPILAPADGTVIEVGDFFFNGRCVFIDHGRGVVSFYGHMSKVDVTPGQKVKQGNKLGEVGKTGRATGAHLHWSIALNTTWVNPQLFLK